MIALQFGRPLAVMRRALVALSIGLGLVCASGPSSAEVADWNKVVTAAKAEGALVLYTALVGAPSTKAIAKAFEAKYGIPVQVLEARASELRERIRTEQSAGRYLGDVMFNSENQVIILKGAPHPNAARLYIDFSMSDEVQQIFAQDGFGIVRRGVLDKISPEARAIAEVKLMGGSDPMRQNEMLDLARSIYK
jgi:ABC-type glycerol-3-phosphate transport system substrate-binding protein